MTILMVLFIGDDREYWVQGIYRQALKGWVPAKVDDGSGKFVDVQINLAVAYRIEYAKQIPLKLAFA